MSLQLSAAGQLPCTAKKLQDGLQQQKQLSRMQSAVTFLYAWSFSGQVQGIRIHMFALHPVGMLHHATQL